MKRKEEDVLSELPSLGSCSTISAALSRNETAQTSYKANRHFLNNSVSSAPPLKSLSGITARVGGALVFPLRFLLTMIHVLCTSASKWRRCGGVGEAFTSAEKWKSRKRKMNAAPTLGHVISVCLGSCQSPEGKVMTYLLWDVGNQFTSVFCCHGFHISPLSHQKRHLQLQIQLFNMNPEKLEQRCICLRQSRSAHHTRGCCWTALTVCLRGNDAADTAGPHSFSKAEIP